MFRRDPIKNFRKKILFYIEIERSEEAERRIRSHGSSVSPWYVGEIGKTYPVLEVNSDAYYVKAKSFDDLVSVMKKDAKVV